MLEKVFLFIVSYFSIFQFIHTTDNTLLKFIYCIFYGVFYLGGMTYKKSIDNHKVESIIDYLLLPLLIPLSINYKPNDIVILFYVINLGVINSFISKISFNKYKFLMKNYFN